MIVQQATWADEIADLLARLDAERYGAPERRALEAAPTRLMRPIAVPTGDEAARHRAQLLTALARDPHA